MFNNATCKHNSHRRILQFKRLKLFFINMITFLPISLIFNVLCFIKKCVNKFWHWGWTRRNYAQKKRFYISLERRSLRGKNRILLNQVNLVNDIHFEILNFNVILFLCYFLLNSRKKIKKKKKRLESCTP